MVRRSARVVLLTGNGELLLIRRTRPGREPYWTTPGGGVEDTDATVEAALHRELAEELGARATAVRRVFVVSSPADGGVRVQHFFVARLAAIDERARTGREYSDPSRGRYELERVDLHGDGLSGIDLKPAALKGFVLAHRVALMAEVASAV